MAAVQNQVLKAGTWRPGLIPLLQQHAVGTCCGVQNDLLTVRDQNAGVGKSLAGLHVLGKHQQLLT